MFLRRVLTPRNCLTPTMEASDDNLLVLIVFFLISDASLIDCLMLPLHMLLNYAMSGWFTWGYLCEVPGIFTPQPPLIAAWGQVLPLEPCERLLQWPYLSIYLSIYLTYTRMLHLPFSDLPLKKCPKVMQPQLGPFFCPEIRAFTGLGARFL